MSDPTAAPTPQPRPGGPLLSYDVPQEVSYSGDSFIVLDIDADWFVASAAADAAGSAS
jgi:hypothetical protein